MKRLIVYIATKLGLHKPLTMKQRMEGKGPRYLIPLDLEIMRFLSLGDTYGRIGRKGGIERRSGDN